mmetsp:Transcript_116792/g.341963  ORF Transcript_116792/g.341963 Transcript_116792/m.341963 type:complete len:231 (-) Transcript_116792:850-1542(-)
MPVLCSHLRIDPAQPSTRPVRLADKVKLPTNVIKVIEEEQGEGVKENVLGGLARAQDHDRVSTAPEDNPAVREGAQVEETPPFELHRYVVVLEVPDERVYSEPVVALPHDNVEPIQNKADLQEECKRLCQRDVAPVIEVYLPIAPMKAHVILDAPGKDSAQPDGGRSGNLKHPDADPAEHSAKGPVRGLRAVVCQPAKGTDPVDVTWKCLVLPKPVLVNQDLCPQEQVAA